MKSLKDFTVITEALQKIATSATPKHDNGTYGKTYQCYFWKMEEMYSKESNDLEVELAKAQLTGDMDRMNDLLQKRKTLPPQKMMVVFRLVKPISVTSTKVFQYGDKQMHYTDNNVQDIYINQDLITSDLLSFTETAKKQKDMSGLESMVIKLHLKECMLEVSKPEKNRRGEVYKESKCYVTAVSYRAMQIAGKILYQDSNAKLSLYGIMPDKELDALFS